MVDRENRAVMGSSIKRVGVVGAGSWGTALANLLAEKGVPVDLWAREEEVYQQIKEERVNGVFLPEMTLDGRLNPVRTFEEALFNKELILWFKHCFFLFVQRVVKEFS